MPATSVADSSDWWTTTRSKKPPADATWDGPDATAIVHLLGDDNPDHMWVLTAGAEVHHTEDAGATWTLVVEGS